MKYNISKSTPSRHAKPGLRHEIYAVFALKSPKRHAPAHRSNTFLSSGIARKWSRIHAFQPKKEGNVRHDG